MINKKLFVVSGGDLVETKNFSVVREKYSYTFSRIKNSLQLRATIRNGEYAWPGCYPMFLIFGDGEACCFKCAKSEYKSISRDMHDGYGGSFQIVGCEINYEDNDLYCAHCNDQIPSAYGDNEEEQ